MAVQGVVLRQCLSSSITCRQPSPRKKVLKKILHFLRPSGKLPLYALLFGCRMGCSMALTGCRIGEDLGGRVFFLCAVFCIFFMPKACGCETECRETARLFGVFLFVPVCFRNVSLSERRSQTCLDYAERRKRR